MPSDPLEPQYSRMDLMALEAGMPKDEMLVGYDDIRDMDSPRVKALQELAGSLSTRIQSETQKTPEYGFESHIRGKPERSVLGGYSRPGGFDYTIDGIPMIDPVEVRPEYQQGGQTPLRGMLGFLYREGKSRLWKDIYE